MFATAFSLLAQAVRNASSAYHGRQTLQCAWGNHGQPLCCTWESAATEKTNVACLWPMMSRTCSEDRDRWPSPPDEILSLLKRLIPVPGRCMSPELLRTPAGVLRELSRAYALHDTARVLNAEPFVGLSSDDCSRSKLKHASHVSVSIMPTLTYA